ncbi:CBS domain-containing protein [Syntrophorhabdus aromaticivorans]|uniref:CBS domain-containing protein n=1 Tax=Syntrophorhabdus aromaticivorans TaxID=328301 RepID=A0A971M4F0_9BACT|nr:CBS domain-containing protein [Syntrophorhabdus aromaticivorans]NLW35474.1 CBS domain-containing protein [Syntrophorhabdus aromaticivorans]
MKVITSHNNADFDSLSSMVAAKKLYPDAVLVFPGSQEKTLREFLIHSTLYVYDIAKIKNIDYNAIDTLVLVDTRQKARIGDLANIVDKEGVQIHVYDHHPPSGEDIKGDLEYIGNTGATVTIIIRILRERGIPISAEEATIMMLGIYEETGSFQYPSTTPEDFDAASFLLSRGANVNLVSDMLVKELTPEQVFLLNDLISNATVYNINGIDIVVTEGSTERYVGDLAVVVHKFRDMENINAIFALFRMEDRVYVIARSRIPEVDVGHILSLMGGGGHKEAASSTMKDMTLIEAREKLLHRLKYNVKPLWKAKDIMFFPVKSVDAHCAIHEAKNIMVKYNINALPVMRQERVAGIITRQIVEKAAFHKLENIPVQEYMTTDASTVNPDDSMERVKEIIIGGNQRFLPVARDGKLIGAITRTDLLRVLEDEIAKSVLGKLEFHERYEKRKNVKKLMDERLDRKTLKRLVDIGGLADALGYHAFLVGGFVRDLLLRNENNDIDIVIEGDGILFAEEMAKRFGVKVRQHKEFATAKIIYPDGFRIDIATARLEYYRAPAALPVVEHSSLKLDLHRRDFTINTLAISLNKNIFGQLIDFFGAQRDIKEKTIRVLHSLSFVEDPTRVFRAIRFEHRFGFQIGKHTMNLIKNAIKMNFLSKLRGKRISIELSHIMREDAPEKVLKRLQELDLMRFISPYLTFDKEKERLFHRMHTVLQWYELLYQGKPCDTLAFWVLGLVDPMTFPQIEDFCRRTEMTESFKRRTLENSERLRSAMMKLPSAMHTMTTSEIYNLLEPLSQEVKLFIMAKTKSEEVKKAISNYITYKDVMKPVFTGKDLKKLGIKEGPVYKAILERLKGAKIDLNLRTKEEEEEFVRSYMAEQGIVP